MVTVAVLTTAAARHELYTRRGGYFIITTSPDVEPTDFMKHEYGRPLSRDEAMEWCETTKRCGGVVHERAVVK